MMSKVSNVVSLVDKLVGDGSPLKRLQALEALTEHCDQLKAALMAEDWMVATMAHSVVATPMTLGEYVAANHHRRNAADRHSITPGYKVTFNPSGLRPYDVWLPEAVYSEAFIESKEYQRGTL